MNVLVVVDMQNDFITGALGNKECQATIPEVVKAINNPKYDKIFITKDTHPEAYLNTQEGRNLPVIHCVKNTSGWEIIPEVQAAINNKKISVDCIKYFEKNTFGSRELGQVFYDMACTSELNVDLVGVCTGICVINNAFLIKANAPEAIINVIEKACACVTPETNKVALEAMKLCQINII